MAAKKTKSIVALEGPLIQAVLIQEGEDPIFADDLAQVLTYWEENGGNLWLDVTAPDESMLNNLSEAFRIDVRDLDHILDPEHKAQVREYPEHLFLQLPVPDRDFLPTDRKGKLERRRQIFVTEELDVYCGSQFVLSMHREEQPFLDDVRDEYLNARLIRYEQWPELLLYTLCDEILGDFQPHIEWLEDQHDRIEALLFAPGRGSQIERVVALKRDLHAVHRAIAPLRDTLATLARRDYRLLTAESRPLFDELSDRAVRLLEVEHNLGSLFQGLLDADLSIQNTKMNEVMKALTVMATIMMPLTVLTGFFGMNFEYIPGLHSPKAFWAVTVGMSAVIPALFWVFRRRGWW